METRFSLHKKRFKRVLLCLLLLGSILLSSCTDFLNYTMENPFFSISNATPLEDDELVMLLISCITDSSSQKSKDVYDKIPRSQLDGISFPSFDAYIKALRRMVNKSVASFNFPSNGKKEMLLKDIEAQVPE